MDKAQKLEEHLNTYMGLEQSSLWNVRNSKMDWHNLYFGKLDRKDIQWAVKDELWQTVRVSMKGISLESKYRTLCTWLYANDFSKQAKIQITNYVTALSRGGLIKPEDYLP